VSVTATAAEVISARTPVAVQAHVAGMDTTNASQNVAISIVPCTHQRSGTRSCSR